MFASGAPLEIVVILVKHPEDGRLFVHERSATKKTFPLHYGIGAGGHREPGETIEAAAQRELQEETGLSTSIRYLFSTEVVIEGRAQIDYVFETVGSFEALPAHDEWQSWGWMDATQIDALLEAEKLCTDTAENWRRYRARIRDIS